MTNFIIAYLIITYLVGIGFVFPQKGFTFSNVVMFILSPILIPIRIGVLLSAK